MFLREFVTVAVLSKQVLFYSFTALTNEMCDLKISILLSDSMSSKPL